MELVKDCNFCGFCFEILDGGYLHSRYYTVILKVRNLLPTRNRIYIEAQYISIERGILNVDHTEPSKIEYSDGLSMVPNSFVDVKLQFEELQRMRDGDRIELIVNKGKIATLLLLREDEQWYIIQGNDGKSFSMSLKNKIEHFESIDEQYGLSLQNFSVNVKDDYHLELFCEVLALNDARLEDAFSISYAIYDKDGEIVKCGKNHKWSNEFKGFEVFEFEIELEDSIDNIGKIRIYPTK